jgi:hypothetical protein
VAKLSDLTDFELPPEGKHTGILVRFVDIGVQTGKFGSSRQADLAFELVGTGELNKPVLAYKRVFNLSSRSKNFREVVRALTGLHDIGQVDTRDLLGKACEIEIEHITTEEGNTYANLECKARKSRKSVPEPETDFVFLSLMPADFNPEDLAKVSERAREKIEASSTYRDLIAMRNHVAASKGKTTAEIIDDGFPENLA